MQSGLPETSSARSHLWLPALVGVVGMLASLGAWWALVTDRRAQLLRDTAAAADEVRRALDENLEREFEALQGLTELWYAFGDHSEDLWRANALQAMEPVAGLRAIVWIGRDDPEPHVAAFPDAAQEIDVSVDAARRARAPALIGPERDPAGRARYRVVLPARLDRVAGKERDEGRGAGTLVAVLDVRDVLASALRARASDYAITVRWGDEEVFARGIPSTNPQQDWWVHRQDIALPISGVWTLRFRPTVEFAATRLNPLPHYLLLAGVVLSLVLALLVHQLGIIRRQAQVLEENNRALERRRTELESGVAERTEALQEAVAELEAFNYSVSHDLRSPLGAILNFATILEEDYRGRPLDAQGVAFIDRIRRCATRATELLEDLLQLSRAGRVPLHLEPIDMSELARETFAQTRAADEGGEVEFIVDALPRALGDRTLLCTLLTNLFSNALKYSRNEEKRRIRVEGAVQGRECIYTISDNGEGFDMRFAGKLFGLFERLHGQEDVEGTGVGLALVARIARRHGGRVWAESSPGQGARFSFAIPRTGAT